MMTTNEIEKAKLLIVDDNAANVALLEDLLDDEGYAHIWSTTDPTQVVDLYKEHEFDLILLDIRMPRMSGIEVMEALQEHVSDDYVPILVLTAQTDVDTRKQALASGAKDFLTKPFEDWEVCLRIRNMLETRIFYNRQRLRADVLEEKVRERTKEVRETQLDIIRRLGRAGEYRDNETGAHVIRMSKMSQILAEVAGLSAEHAERILYASPMHDVGKIGIPDHILLKPGRFEEDEWEIMQNHAQIGADIVGDHPSEMLQLASLIAETHHEKWDGSGYPKGLKGEEIPIESRIVAISDVYDALTSTRPYKKPWSNEDAVKLINDEAGKHFDPKLVELFNQVLPQFIAIKEEYPDEEIPKWAKDRLAQIS